MASSSSSSSHWHDYSRSSYLPLAPVPVMVRVMINNRVEFVLFPGTLALSPHVFAKFAARHRALFVLYTPVNKRRGFELENSWSWQIGRALLTIYQRGRSNLSLVGSWCSFDGSRNSCTGTRHRRWSSVWIPRDTGTWSIRNCRLINFFFFLLDSKD